MFVFVERYITLRYNGGTNTNTQNKLTKLTL